MDFATILAQFNSDNVILYFFKAFAILFSFMFLLYAVVNARQTQVLNTVLQSRWGAIIMFISILQIGAAALLIFLSITLL
jgi:hypothetical protein